MRMYSMYFTSCLMLLSFCLVGQNDFQKVNVDLDISNLKEDFQRSNQHYIDLPLVGESHRFMVVESPMISDDFAKARPDIRTYNVFSTSDHSIYGRLLITENEVSHFIKHPEGSQTLYKELGKSKNSYAVEKGVNPDDLSDFICGHIKDKFKDEYPPMRGKTGKNGSLIRTFRFAAIGTGEFTAANGGNLSAQNKIISTLNSIQVIFQNDLAVKFEVLNPVVYGSAATDVFIPDQSGGAGRTQQAASAVNNLFDSSSYDIGHVFHNTSQPPGGWSGGGVAGLGVLCRSSGWTGGGLAKGAGWSGVGNNNGVGWIQLAAHEIGHQFNAPHTFAGTGGSCTDNISVGTSYEIASGTTLMSYNGICGAGQNLPNGGANDGYFHANSLDRMVTHMNLFADCGSSVMADNAIPDIIFDQCAESVSIPKGTPFRLYSDVQDTLGGNLTYSWEQYNAGTKSTQGLKGAAAGNNPIAPLFRVFPASNSNIRYFPALADLLSGTVSDWEVLPNVGRTLNFRLIARDNYFDGGGLAWKELDFQVSGAGPFVITSPGAGETYAVGDSKTIRWSTNGSDNVCSTVDIQLSLDGGFSYPIFLATDVPYSDEQFALSVPEGVVATENARIMISCADNDCIKFFNLTPEFRVESSCTASLSNLCNSTFQQYNQQEEALKLDIGFTTGLFVSEVIKDINAGSPVMQLAMYDATETGCFLGFPNSYETTSITTTEAGTYTLFVQGNYNGGAGILSIFNKSNFDPVFPCESFVGSTATTAGANSWTPNGSMSVELEACREYVIVLYNTASLPTATRMSNIDGPAGVNGLPSSATQSYSYTYLAVEQETQLVEMVSDEANFIPLKPGDYDIVGASYKSSGATPPPNTNPQNWVGLTLNQVKTSGSCFIVSSNIKPISVKTSCFFSTNVSLGAQSECDPNTNQYSQDLIVEYQMPPEDGNLVINGQSFPVTGSPQSVTLDGLISDGEPVSLFATFSEDLTCVRPYDSIFIAKPNCCPFEIELPMRYDICEGETAMLDPGDVANTYVWYRDGQLLQDSNDRMFSTKEDGIYEVRIFDGNGCQRRATTVVQNQPLPTIRLGENREVCGGGTQTVYAEANVDSVAWFINGVQQDTITERLPIFESGTYMAIAVTPFGCKDTAMVELMVLPTPEVSLDPFQTACEGDTVVLQAIDEEDNTYTWSTDITFQTGILAEDGPILEVFEEGVFHIRVVNEFGCEVRDASRIDFNPNPIIMLPDDDAICPNQNFSILSDSDSGTHQLQWYRDGEAIPAPAGTGPALNTPIPATYIIEATAQLPPSFCVSRDTFVLSEYELPIVELGESTPICGDDAVISLPFEEGVTYTWASGGTELQSGPNNELIVTNPGFYNVTVENSEGCTETDFTEVEFGEPITISINEDDVNQCDDDDLFFSSTTNPNTFNVQWFLDGELVRTGPTSGSIEESGTLVAIAQNGQDGCTDADSVQINFFSEPEYNFEPFVSACTGSDLVLSFDSAAEFDVAWVLNGAVVYSENDFLVMMPGDYELQLSNALGCDYTTNVTVEFETGPNLSIAGSNTGCQGETISLTANTNGIVQSWSKDGEIIMGQTGFMLDVTESGEYSVSVQGDSECIIIQSIEVNFSSAPNVSLGNDQTFCNDTTLLLSTSESFAEVLWYKDGVIFESDATEVEVSESGEYILSVFNENTCEDRDTVNIVIGGLAPLSGPNTVFLCDGEPTQVTIEADQNLDFEWSSSNLGVLEESSNTLMIDEVGTYTFKASNDEGCSTNVSFLVEFAAKPIISLDETAEACQGMNYDITASVDLGSITWDKDGTVQMGMTSNTLSVSENGLYTITVENDNGCIDSKSIDVTFNSPPEVELASSFSLCPGTLVSLSTPTEAQAYQWTLDSDPMISSNADIFDVNQAGSYTLMITDENGCTNIASTIVELSDRPDVELGEDIQNCGSAMVELDAGNGGSTYEWTLNGMDLNNSSNVIQALEEGEYIVQVSAGGDCINADTIQVSFFEEASVMTQESISVCQGSDEILEASTMNNIISWTVDGNDLNNQTSSVDITIAGTYEVIVSSDDGCTASAQTEVNIVETIDVSLGEDMMTCDPTPITLNAGNQGNTFSWTLNGEAIDDDSSEIEVDQDGTYIVEVSVGEDCSSLDTIDIDFLEVAEVMTLDSISVCEGSNAELTANTMQNIDSWTLNGEDLNTQENTINISTNGLYEVIVSSDDGCTALAQTNVEIIDGVDVDLGEDISTCTPQEIMLDAGTDGSTFEWTLNGDAIEESSNAFIPDLPGMYIVNVSAGDDCSSMDTIQVDFLEEAMVELPMTLSYCEGNTVDIEANTMNNIVSWSLGGTDLNTQETSLTVSTPGLYEVVVSSDDGCTAVMQTNVNVVEGVDVNLGPDIQSCGNEDLELNAGTDGSTYEWTIDGEMQSEDGNIFNPTLPGTYIVNVSAGDDCSSMDTIEVDIFDVPMAELPETFSVCMGIPSMISVNTTETDITWTLDGEPLEETGASISVDSPGLLEVMVSSSNGCTNTASTTIAVVAQPSVNLGDDLDICQGDPIELFAGSNWNEISWTLNDQEINGETEATLIPNAPGTYIANVSIGTACTASDTIEVSIGASPEITLPGNMSICSGESTMINAVTDATEVVWTLDGIIQSELIGNNIMVDIPGTYEATAVGDGDCSQTASIEITELPRPDYDFGEDVAVCDSQGIDLNAGSDWNTLQWFYDGSLILQNNGTLTATDSGTYIALANNGEACSYADTIVISFTTAPNLQLDSELNLCDGDTETLVVQEGVNEYQWFLDGVAINGADSNEIIADQSGTYSVTGSNGIDCDDMASIDVNIIESPEISLGGNVDLCPGDDLLIDAGVHSTYSWSNGTSGQTVSVANNFVTISETLGYVVTVTNDNECSSTASISVDLVPVLQASISSTTEKLCSGETAMLTAVGGTMYSWTNQDGLDVIEDTPEMAWVTPSVDTEYTVLVSDDCPDNTASATITIAVVDDSDIEVSKDTCIIDGESIMLSASGGIQYSWFTASENLGSDAIIEVKPEETTTYTVTVETAEGCQIQRTVEICLLANPLDEFEAVTMITPNNDGMNDELEFTDLASFGINRLSIYNRWGLKIIEYENYQSDGILFDGTINGKEIPADTYYYILELNDGAEIIKKPLTIVR